VCGLASVVPYPCCDPFVRVFMDTPSRLVSPGRASVAQYPCREPFVRVVMGTGGHPTRLLTWSRIAASATVNLSPGRESRVLRTLHSPTTGISYCICSLIGPAAIWWRGCRIPATIIWGGPGVHRGSQRSSSSSSSSSSSLVEAAHWGHGG
jgi:hypothetical protein